MSTAASIDFRALGGEVIDHEQRWGAAVTPGVGGRWGGTVSRTSAAGPPLPALLPGHHAPHYRLFTGVESTR
ncbi:hypothetical protein OG948_57895 (plasmid) [Embleya sp. NBC_00888]|uniref:hypothetical protein n=1 Tax=Embleya sp. NBC_00888 TaxID=2975960 RepID=UPI002F9131D6|nr:hypothetical protein OG948_57895 [Embleya sp. NBC_00888]